MKIFLSGSHPNSLDSTHRISSNMKIKQFLCLVYTFMEEAKAYNLDTFYPVLYESSNENGKGGDDYFGMSVAIRPKAAELNGTWFVQIGAPRGNLKKSGIREPGVVYRCHLYGPCRMIFPDKSLGTFQNEGVHSYEGKEDGAWIGGSMDIKKVEGFERSVVCGSRWINQYLKNSENIDVTYLMTGICYLQDLFNETHESEFSKLLPLVNSDKIYSPKPYVVNLSTYHWGLGQAGTSVVLTEAPARTVIGAPGVTHWVGSVVRYDRHLSVTVGNFAKTEIPKKNRYTYLGYSVAAGKFYEDKKVWFAAGAPRSANYRGQVFTFRFKDSTDKVHVQSVLTGNTFGEYFGSSLTAEDVNGDNYDDLIVGAPTFSKRHPDEGRIYVYLGTSKGNYFLPAQVINGKIGRGRFGSCTASLKDLDQDGHNDVAVGAPYEDDQKGAVYIYRGFPMGLQSDHAQRVAARDLYPYLRGFGISISAAVDVDGNKYGDIVVGSYLSGHVVLLRSRPIISLHPQVKIKPGFLLDRQASFLNVSLCSRYTGSNVPPRAEIVRTVEIDPLHGRGSIRLHPAVSAYKKRIHLGSHEISCETFSILLNLSEKNYSPLMINLKIELPSCLNGKRKALIIRNEEMVDGDRFLKWCPTGRKAEISKGIPFAGICGIDSVCHSDVKLSCTIPEFDPGSYIIGSSDHFQLFLHLVNLAEPAYDTKVKIWSSVGLIWNEEEYDSSSSSQIPRKIFWQNIEGVFSESFEMNFSFKIPFEKVSESDLVLTVEVDTSNIDVDLDNNKCRFSVRLISDASVKLRSSSSLEKFFLSEKRIIKQLNVTQFYEVEKAGFTPILEAELRIYVPSCFGGELISYEVETSDWIHLVQADEKNQPEEGMDLGLAIPPKGNCSSPGTPLFPSCSDSKDGCSVLKIIFLTGIPSGPSSYVKIIMGLNISTIESIEGNVANFTTFAILRHKTFFRAAAEEIRADASVVLFGEKKKKSVEGYVIALSVLSGGFILFLIVSWLVRKKFFQRAKKQELKSLRDAETSFIYFTTKAHPAITMS